MTKIYNEKTEVKEVVTRKLDYVRCDWCGEVIPAAEPCNDNKPEIQTQVELTVTFPCYETGYGYAWEINDLCLSCSEKLKEHLKEIGITITEREIEW